MARMRAKPDLFKTLRSRFRAPSSLLGTLALGWLICAAPLSAQLMLDADVFRQVRHHTTLAEAFSKTLGRAA